MIVSPFSVWNCLFRNYSNKLEHLVIIGSGWGAYRALGKLDQSKYQITVISPKDYFVFTPFLTGVSVGTIEERSAIESIRKEQKGGTILVILQLGLSHILASVTSIDFKSQTIFANPAIPSISNSSPSPSLMEKFSPYSTTSDILKITYDKLIIACGAVVNTFNTQGVSQHAVFLKDVTDAQTIRSRIISLFDEAALPATTPQKRSQLLHFVVVGGGPTGIEFLGELYDLIYQDLVKIFPAEIINTVTMTLFDVAPTIMATFNKALVDYTIRNLKSRKSITIRTSTVISHITATEIFVKGPHPESVPYGLVLWATGIAPAPLLATLKSSTDEVRPAIDQKSGRFITDKYLRLLQYDLATANLGAPFENVWAIGDCASPEHPPTAQVAKQKGEYLGVLLNKLHSSVKFEDIPPFTFKDRGYMAYIGQGKAVACLHLLTKKIYLLKGRIGRWAWNFAYLSMLRSWRNRILVPLYWTLTFLLGREVSCLKPPRLDPGK